MKVIFASAADADLTARARLRAEIFTTEEIIKMWDRAVKQGAVRVVEECIMAIAEQCIAEPKLTRVGT